MADREPKVVDLLGHDREVIVPYTDVEIKGPVIGKGEINTEGHIDIRSTITSNVDVEGIVEGQGTFDREGDLRIHVEANKEVFGDWVVEISKGGKVLNIFRRRSK